MTVSFHLSIIVRSFFLTSLLFAAMFSVPYNNAIGSPDVKKNVCKDLESSDFDKYKKDKDIIKMSQKGLETIFKTNKAYELELQLTTLLSDGVIGKETLAWLKQFYVDYPAYAVDCDVPDAVMRSALHYAEIAEQHPDWKQTVTSPEFDGWIRNASNVGSINIRQIRRSGAAPMVNRLLNEYASRGAEGGGSADGANDETCSMLAEKQDIEQILVRLKDQDIYNRNGKNLTQELKRGLRAVFADNPDYKSEWEEHTVHLSTETLDTETGKWLERFCRDFSAYGSPDDVAESVVRSALHFAEIAAVHPDWKVVITNPAFNQWVRASDQEKHPENRQLRLSGSAPNIIALIDEYSDQPSDSAPSIIELIEQGKEVEEDKIKPLQLNTGEFGCARQWDRVVDKYFIVYGFYPFWMSVRDAENKASSNGEDSSEQTEDESQDNDSAAVDFSVLSRIGYFALELDDKGKIVDRGGHWTEEGGAERFIKKAHKYNSKVDVVIEATNWKEWNDSTNKRSVNSIRRLLDRTKPNAIIPDGITVYFPDFAGSEPEQHKKIVVFVKKLRKELGALGGEKRLFGGKKRLFLNILIDDGNPEYNDETRVSKPALLGGLKDEDEDEDILVGNQAVDLVLVLLHQPVTEKKKWLRLAIENEFRGEQRRDVLRKILPVISSNVHEGKPDERTLCNENNEDPYWQLQHDLTYFRDNFRGVALWPLPTSKLKVLKERLDCTFASDEKIGITIFRNIESWFRNVESWLCVFVCPNRYIFWIAFWFLSGLLILLALLAYWSCRIKNALTKRLYYILGILGGGASWIMISVALITCDPRVHEGELVILSMLVAILISSWVIYYIKTIKQGSLP